MPQGGPQDDPEGLKTALLALQDALRRPQDAPKTPPRRPEDDPKMRPTSAWKATLTAMGAQTPSKRPFTILDRFGVGF